MPLTFKKPPLNEVALGYTFLPRPDLLIPHIGQFWTEIVDTYPKCQHAVPMFDNLEQSMLTEIPLPRVWFLSEDGTSLVQLQQDRLLFNWRDIGASNPYLRFPAIKAEFDRVNSLFRTYVEKVTGEEIRPVSYNLTYVNVLKQGDGWASYKDVGKVFPDLRWREKSRFLPPPDSTDWKAVFPLPDDSGRLTVQVQAAKLVKDNQPILKFELTAKSESLGGRSIDFDKWAEMAHTWIVESFKDLTGEEMHNDVWLIEKGS